MPATVVIFSCHILRFSMSLKYSASTEKSPQPGHQVGLSAANSFLLKPLRSDAGSVGVGTEVILLRCGISSFVSFIGLFSRLNVLRAILPPGADGPPRCARHQQGVI